QPGVAALRHDRCAGFGGKLEDRRDLLDRTRAQYQRRASMIQTALLDQIGFDRPRVGQRILVADDSRETGESVGRDRSFEGAVHAQSIEQIQRRGVAARISRSLIASPRPWCGIGMTAIAAAPEASSARRCENKLAAASTRSSRAERLRIATAPAASGGGAPNANSASPGCTFLASSRSRAFGA